MNIALVAIAKDEELYIQEWLEYYRKLGVNRFFIFDNNELGNDKLEHLLKYEKDLILIDVRGRKKLEEMDFQHGIYKFAYEQFSSQFDYMGFFDIDEFLYLCDKTIPEWLNEHQEFNDTDIIKFNWLIYGDNEQLKYEPKPVQERFTIPCHPLCCYRHDFPESYHIKCLVKTGKKMINCNCHSFELENGIAKATDGQITDMLSNVYDKPFFKYGYVKHYVTKSIEEFVKKKCITPSDAEYKFPRRNEDWIRLFFSINEDTKEKRKILSSILNKK